MKRVIATAAVLLTLVGALAASVLVPVTQASTPAAPAASAPAAADFTFASPVNVSQNGNSHPAVLGAMGDGSVNLAYLDGTNTELDNAFNHSFGGPFDSEAIESGSLGSQRMVTDTHGGDHLIWFINRGGSTVIRYAYKTAGGSWHLFTIPGSDTPASSGYKVLGIARGQSLGATDRIVVMWARNSVGARVSWTDDNGANWAEVEDVPGAFNGQATDYDVGATTSGHIFVGWFQRSPNDIFVQERLPNGTWATVTDVSARPVKYQDYTPRFGTAPDGGLRLVWTGYSSYNAASTDGFYREWSPTTGWSPTIVQMWNTAGGGNSRGLEITVDSAGVSHIVWDDDSHRDEKNVTTYYIRGQGTSFTTPQQVVPQFGTASARYPFVAVGPVPDGSVKVHISTNANRAGFDNYYTWTDDAGVSGTPLPSATPTFGVCTANQYRDVPTTDPFYPYIHDLSVRGAISGYSDCTFRTYNNITRSQIAKVIVLADGYQLISPPNADFADVPPGSPFYDVVETAFHNNLISGYNCGGPGEPCDAQNHPYFRPFTNVTRGQLSKMVVLGRQWHQVNPATGSFADVAPGTAFYTVIETAYAHGIISGYNCGGPGEPCDAQQRPYFRQNNTATRGQASKIIDLALYSAEFTPTPQPTATTTNTPVVTNTPIVTSTPTTTNTPVVTSTPTTTRTPAGTATVTQTAQPAGTATVTRTPGGPTATVTPTPLLPTVTITIVVPTVTITIVVPTVTVTIPVR